MLKYANQFKEDKEKRDAVLNLLLPKVRWLFIVPDYLVETVESEESIAHLPITHQLLHETYKYFSCPDYTPKLFECSARTGYESFLLSHLFIIYFYFYYFSLSVL